MNDNTLRLDAGNVLTLRAPDARFRLYYDTQQPGLAVCVTASGARSYVVTHWDAERRRTLRYTIAKVGAITIEAAREAVLARKANVAVGRDDPFKREARRRSDLTLAKVLDDYLRIRTLKDRTRDDYRRIIEGELKDWLTRPVDGIAPEEVTKRYESIAADGKKHRTAGLVMAVLRALFRFAIAYYTESGRPLVTVDPTRKLRVLHRGWSRVERRSTSIPLHLMPRFFTEVAARVADPDRYTTATDYVALLALTGLRRSEAANMQWADIDLERGTYLIPVTKSRTPLHLPMSRQARAIVERRAALNAAKSKRERTRYVFPADGMNEPLREPRNALIAVCKAIGCTATPHDLRRTFIAACDAADLSFVVLKLLVNHRMPDANDGVTMGYASPDAPRLRDAVQRVANLLDGTTEGAKA